MSPDELIVGGVAERYHRTVNDTRCGLRALRLLDKIGKTLMDKLEGHS